MTSPLQGDSSLVYGETRVVRAVHGTQEPTLDPSFELELSQHLLKEYGAEGLTQLYGQFVSGQGSFDGLMRRAVWRALAKQFGHGAHIAADVRFRNPETFEIGDTVFIGPQAYLQGMRQGRLKIGNHVWIGPQSYFDARDVVLEDWVGWGPGAKALCSEHVGVPTDRPIVQTDLRIKPIVVKEWADIGTNAVILPGVTVGKGAVVGAGAIVSRDVPDYAVVAGVPARFLRWREGHAGPDPEEKTD